MTPGQLAEKIFQSIETDLRDRRGLGREWDRISDALQLEIRKVNQEKIRDLLILFTYD